MDMNKQLNSISACSCTYVELLQNEVLPIGKNTYAGKLNKRVELKSAHLQNIFF